MNASDKPSTAVVIVQRTELALSRSAPLARRGLQTLNSLHDAERSLTEGWDYFYDGDLEKAFRCFLQGLDRSPLHGRLHCALGLMSLHGCGTPQNGQKALWHIRMSAEVGNSAGQLALARIYRSGVEVPKDDEMAYLWTERAAQQNNIWAAVSLGEMFELGVGVQQDDQQAVYWYLRAMEHGGYVWQTRVTRLQKTIPDFEILDGAPSDWGETMVSEGSAWRTD